MWNTVTQIQGIPTTQDQVTQRYGVPRSKVEALLNHVHPVQQYQFALGLDDLFQQHQYDVKISRSFIAAADLLKELHYHRPHDAQYGGAYIADVGPNCDVPVVFDTGCSFSVTPFESDFVTDIEPTEVKELVGLTDKVMIQGVGTVEWPIRDVFGQIGVLRMEAYYVPTASIRLCSPQQYLAENEGGRCEFDHRRVIFTTASGQELTFPFSPHSNIPLMVIDHEILCAGPTTHLVRALAFGPEFKDQLGSLISDTNYNLTQPQKELLLWHNRLGHAGFAWLQELMNKVKHVVGDTELPAIATKLKGTSRCVHPRCPACQLGKQHRRTPGTSTVHSKPENEMMLRRDHLSPGDCISMDQYVCRKPGRLAHTFGKEDKSLRYSGGTIFCDHASQYIWINHQISLRVGDTLQGKHAFEKFALEYGVKFKSFHADNQPFRAAKFQEDLDLQGQTITYSGVGAHHSNGVSERSIKTITTWARSMMMHVMIHWPDQFDEALWPFAINYATHIWNNLPRSRHGLSPIELFTGVKSPSFDAIQRARTWGCPVYVLDPRLQDGKKLPKWKKRSRLGQFLGVSSPHSTTVGQILNLDTGAISPQYHLVYDEQFTTVPGYLTDELFDSETWNNLLGLDSLENSLDPNDCKDDSLPFPDLFDDFVHPTPDPSTVPHSPLPEGDQSEDEQSIGSFDSELPTIYEDMDDESDHEPQQEPIGQRTRSKVSEGEQSQGSEGALQEQAPPVPIPAAKPRTVRRKKTTKHVRQSRHRPSTRSSSIKTRTRSQPKPRYAATYQGQRHRQELKVAQHVRERYLAGGNPNMKIRASTLDTSTIHGLDWENLLSTLRTPDAKTILFQMMRDYNAQDGTLEQWHPMASSDEWTIRGRILASLYQRARDPHRDGCVGSSRP